MKKTYYSAAVYRGANMYKKTSNEREGTPMKEPLYYITKFCPTSMASCLDDCIKPAPDSTYEHPNWGLDFSFIFENNKMHTKVGNKADEDVSYRASTINRVGKREPKRSSILLKLQRYDGSKEPALKESARSILDHPVVHTFVHKRWDEIKWIYYILTMLSHFIYSLTFTSHCILVYHDICPISLDENYYSTNRTSLFNVDFIQDFKTEIPCNVTGKNETKVKIMMFTWICLLIFTFILLVREVLDFIDQKRQKFYQVDTWIHWGIIVMACIGLAHGNCYHVLTSFQSIKAYKFQHHAAVWGIFMTWCQLFLYMGRTPTFGLFINMFRRVARTFLNLIWAFVSLLLAFTFTFYLLFPSHFAFDNDIPSVFVKVNMIFTIMKCYREYYNLSYLKKQIINCLHYISDNRYDDWGNRF